ncbi:TPA: hypothetical protein DIC20_00785 [Candidatus Dependentiae bacterium]|nr:MAG: hypothetical protein US13_C0009G0029 [candidate division TM6 bacterium GW2011_GWE2_36_25]HBR71016.1 hypothetical protein [Candidatus Dependentiae bacterium]HCU00222.1 hypothetical protein [Candidatus Dependentiae bacterium]
MNKKILVFSLLTLFSLSSIQAFNPLEYLSGFFKGSQVQVISEAQKVEPIEFLPSTGIVPMGLGEDLVIPLTDFSPEVSVERCQICTSLNEKSRNFYRSFKKESVEFLGKSLVCGKRAQQYWNGLSSTKQNLLCLGSGIVLGKVARFPVKMAVAGATLAGLYAVGRDIWDDFKESSFYKPEEISTERKEETEVSEKFIPDDNASSQEAGKSEK